MSKNVLVTGLIEREGIEVITNLARHQFDVTVIPVKPQNKVTRMFSEMDEETMHHVSITDFNSIGGFDPGNPVIIMTSAREGFEKEVEYGKKIIDKLKQTGYKQVIFISRASANNNTRIPMLENKLFIERMLENSRLPHVVVAPVIYMGDIMQAFSVNDFQVFRIALPISKEKPIQFVAPESVGDFIAVIINKGIFGNGTRYEIASEELTGNDMVSIFSRVVGKEFQYREIPLDVAKQYNYNYGKFMEWLNEQGFSVEIDKLKFQFPEVNWISFQDFITRQNWSLTERFDNP